MNLRAILKGWGISIAIILIIAVIASVIGLFCDLDAGILRMINLGGVCIAVFASSLGVSKTSEKMRLLNSMLVAFLCVLFLIVLSMMLNGAVVFGMHFLTVIICSAAAAALGTFLS